MMYNIYVMFGIMLFYRIILTSPGKKRIFIIYNILEDKYISFKKIIYILYG